jgi:plastocyanin
MMSFSTTTTFAVVLLITTLLFVIAATSTAVLVSAAAAAEKTTTTTTITVDNWYIPYDGPKTLTANVGDTITFGWNTGHNVYIHPTMDCELDGVIFVGDTSPTSYTFTDADADADADGTDMFFACDIGSGLHCKNGKYSTVQYSTVNQCN